MLLPPLLTTTTSSVADAYFTHFYLTNTHITKVFYVRKQLYKKYVYDFVQVALVLSAATAAAVKDQCFSNQRQKW